MWVLSCDGSSSLLWATGLVLLFLCPGPPCSSEEGNRKTVSERPLALLQGRAAEQTQAFPECPVTSGDDASPDVFLPLLEVQASGGFQCEGSRQMTQFGRVRGQCALSTHRKEHRKGKTHPWCPKVMSRRPGREVFDS